MVKVNSLLTERFKKATGALSKMTTLVEKSSNGNLSSFSGVFKVSTLSLSETKALSCILSNYSEEGSNIDKDLSQLCALTAEVKAINTQAILLHGERIKRAQELLTRYREGAFSAWLIASYGNRQTPYNFLQYYELYSALPQNLHGKLDEMPRQIAYSLASRNGTLEKKTQVIETYAGQTKQELLSLIRALFPLSATDARASDAGDSTLKELHRIQLRLETAPFQPSKEQKRHLIKLLNAIKAKIQNS